MKRKIQIKGYTRTVKGKTVKVKPYSRMTGKDGVSKEGAGTELSHRKAARASEKKAPVYNTDPNAMTPSGMTRKEFDEAAVLQDALRTYQRAPQWQRQRMLDDPHTGPVLKKYFAEQSRTTEKKSRKRLFGRKEKSPKPKKEKINYSQYGGITGRINRLADRLNAFADRKIAESRKK